MVHWTLDGWLWLTRTIRTTVCQNTIEYMMNGKAIARAVRAHFLIDAALNTLMLSEAQGVPIPNQDGIQAPEVILRESDQLPSSCSSTDSGGPEIFHEAHSLYQEVMDKSKSLDEMKSCNVLQVISDLLQK